VMAKMQAASLANLVRMAGLLGLSAHESAVRNAPRSP
jgi:hypothetical protein